MRFVMHGNLNFFSLTLTSALTHNIKLVLSTLHTACRPYRCCITKEYGDTALIWAACYGNIEITNLKAEVNADVNINDNVSWHL